MTLADVYSKITDLETLLKSVYDRMSIINTQNFFDYTIKWLQISWTDELRFDDPTKVDKSMSKWMYKAITFEPEYTQISDWFKSYNSGDIVGTTTTQGTNENEVTNTSSNTTEMASNPSIDQATPFDNLPYVQSQQRAKANLTNESRGTTGATTTQTVEGINKSKEMMNQRFYDFELKFNKVMRYIFRCIDMT